MLELLSVIAALVAGPAAVPPVGGRPPAVPQARGAVLDRGLRATPVSAVGDVLARSSAPRRPSAGLPQFLRGV